MEEKIFVVALIIIFGLVIFGANLEYKRDESCWNDNICTECETKNCYILEAAFHTMNNGTEYIYRCKNCNHVIKIHQLH
jgi:hypothetical protein